MATSNQILHVSRFSVFALDVSASEWRKREQHSACKSSPFKCSRLLS